MFFPPVFYVQLTDFNQAFVDKLHTKPFIECLYSEVSSFGDACVHVCVKKISRFLMLTHRVSHQKVLSGYIFFVTVGQRAGVESDHSVYAEKLHRDGLSLRCIHSLWLLGQPRNPLCSVHVC